MKITQALQSLPPFFKPLREERFPVQYGFADVIDLERSYYSKWERYGGDMKLSTFFRMCRTLRIQPWAALYMVLAGKFDFTEEDGREWGE